MYSRIYDSMVAWYSNWYQSKQHCYRVTSFAMSAFLFLNMLTLSAVLDVLGMGQIGNLMLNTPLIPLLAVVGLIFGNLAYGRSPARQASWRGPISSVRDRRAMVAILYVAGTIAGFVVSMALFARSSGS
jgi:hypothetical protein